VFLGGGAALLGDQFVAVLATIIYSGLMSLAIIFVLTKVLPGGVRVPDEEEDTGLDLGEHAEVGYSFAER
jgi:Amt family ammonium transporter